MIDRTVHQAVKGRAKTVPVDKKPKAKTTSSNAALAPDELALAIEMARSDRLEQELSNYSYRKGSRA